MSWSFYATGKPAAVINKAKQDLGSSKCYEPEETIKQLFLSQLEISLSVFPDKTAVEVKASGSQGSYPDDKYINNLSVSIMPIYNFVE